MTDAIAGLHHVTAITSDAQRNIDFYTGLLGLRMTKLTVNFDDPGTYHLYYGDDLGRPGTNLTFFAWPGATRGRVGPPQVTATGLAVPAGAVPFWVDRLRANGVTVSDPVERFGERVAAFEDFDGMRLEVVEVPGDGPGVPRANGPVPVGRAIRGISGVTMSVEGYEHTAQLLTGTLGFRAGPSEGNRFRYTTGAGGAGSVVDVLCTPDARHGGMGAGAVHHVAWRAADDAAQLRWLTAIAAAGRNVSPVMDRTYFHSIYFREPGGVLFEIATDGPGFTADEPAESIGTRLMLPPWAEPVRDKLMAVLPKVKLPGVGK